MVAERIEELAELAGENPHETGEIIPFPSKEPIGACIYDADDLSVLFEQEGIGEIGNSHETVVELGYSAPNPNASFGTHPPRETYTSGFPNWFPKDSANRTSVPIDRSL